MQILIPGFIQPSKVYELKLQKSGELELKLKESISEATIQDLADEHLDNRHTILVDGGYPEIIEKLQRNGFHVIHGRL